MTNLPKPPAVCPLCGDVWGAPFQGDVGNPYCFHDRMAWSEMEEFHYGSAYDEIMDSAGDERINEEGEG